MKKCYILILLLTSTLTAFSTTYYWTGGTSAFWNSSSSWNTTLGGGGSSRTVPSSSDILIFDGSNIGGGASGAVSASFTGFSPETVQSLVLQNNAAITFSGNTSNTALTGNVSRAASVSLASCASTIGSTTITCASTTNVYPGSYITAGDNVEKNGSNFITTVNSGTDFTMANPANSSNAIATQLAISQPLVFASDQTGIVSAGDFIYYNTSGSLGQILSVINGTTMMGANTSTIASQACAKVTSILSISTQLTVGSGSTLALSCNLPNIVMLASGALGTVYGTISIGTNKNRLLVDNGGSAKLSFKSGSTFESGTGTGSPFGSMANATNDCVVFESGANYSASANPAADSPNAVFGANSGSSVVSFQSGSNYIHNSAAYSMLGFSTRAYPNVVIAAGTAAYPAATPMENLTINPGLSITAGSNSYQIIKGNISIGAGSTINTTGTPAFVLSGTSQTLTGSGSVTGNGLCKLYISPNSTFTLGMNATQAGASAQTKNYGVLDFGNYTFTNALTTGALLTGVDAAAGSTTTGTVVAGSPYTMVLSSSSGFLQGMEITGIGIPANTIIAYAPSVVIYLTNPVPAGTYTVTSNNKSDGATFITANAGGLIASYPLGGTATYSVGTCNFTFNGSSAQITGASFPSTINNLTINNAAGLTTDASTTINGTLALTSGNLTTGATTLTLKGATTGSGNIVTATVGVLAYTGTAQTISNLPSNTVHSLTLNNAAGIFTMGSSVTVEAVITLTNGTLVTGANTLTLQGTVSSSGCKISTSTTGTVNYGCSGSIGNIFTNATVNNLGIYSSISMSASNTVSNTLTLVTGTLSSAANMTLASGATIVRTAGALSGTPVFSGTVNVTYNNTSATVAGTEIPSSTAALTNLTINNAAGVTLSAATTVNGALALTSGDLTTGAYVLSIKGTTTGTGNIATASNGTVCYCGSSAQIISNLSSATAYKLTIDNAAGVSLGSSTTVTNLLTLTTGDLTTGAYTLSLKYATTSGSGTIVTASNGTLEYSGTGAQTISNLYGNTVNNLKINNSGSSNISLGANTTVDGVLTLTDGSMNTSTYTLTHKGTTSAATGTLSTGATGMLIYNGGAAQTATGLSTIYNLTIDNASGVTLGQSVTVITALVLTAGNLSTSTYNLTLQGTTSGAGFIATGTGAGVSGHVLYTGSSAQTISNIYNNNAYKITVNNTAGVSMSAPITIGSNLYLLAGQLDNSTNNITIPGGKILNRAAGTLAVAPVFGAGMHLTYYGSTNISTGVEMPTSTSALNQLIINTTGNAIVTLSAAVTVNSALYLTAGVLDNSSFDLNIVSTKAITRTNGTLIAAPVFAGLVDITYNATSSTTTGPEMPTSTSALRDLTINNTAGVVLNADVTVNRILYLNNNLTTGANTLTFADPTTNSISGAGIIAAATGTIVYKGSAQTITNNYSGSVNNLTINSSSNITLGAALSVAGTLTFTAGKLSLGAYDLTVASGGSIVSSSATKYVVTDGIGKLIQTVSAGVDKLFPIGISTASYDPATINATTSLAFSAGVGSTFSGTLNDPSLSNPRQWDIAPASGTPTATITLTPSVATHVSNPVHGRYSSGEWNQTIASLSGSSFTATYAGLTAASFGTGSTLAFRIQYIIGTSATNGSISGSSAGNYDGGTSLSFTATADPSYRFVNWTVGGTQVSTANPYAFTVSADRALVANFASPTITVAGTTLTSTFADCPTCDVTVNGTGTLSIDEARTMHDVTLNTGGKLLVSNPMTINNLVFKADQTTSFSANISANVTIAGTVKFLKTMDDTKWYFMSFPCDILISDIKLSDGSAVGTLNTNWFIKYYDGAQRIQNLGSATNWKNASPTGTGSETLTAFKGYIFGLKDPGTVEIMFPIVKDSVKNEPARVIPVTAYGDGVLTNDLGNAVADTHKGWNLVGQPYFSKYNGTGTNLTYLNIFEGNAYTTYYKTDASTIFPFSAYFVQADAALAASKITFALNSRLSAPAAVRNDLTDMVQINVTTATGTDKTNLIIDESESPVYQINHDMEKWITTGSATPQLFTSLNGVNYAYNALPVESVQDLPLAIYTKTTTASTISAEAAQAPGLSQLLLTDRATGIVTDLLSSDYRFTASSGLNSSRFSISAQRVATKLTGVLDTVVNPVQLFVKDKLLLINNIELETSVKVYDTLGRLVAIKKASNGSLNIPLEGVGVYTVLLQQLAGKQQVRRVICR